MLRASVWMTSDIYSATTHKINNNKKFKIAIHEKGVFTPLLLLPGKQPSRLLEHLFFYNAKKQHKL